MTSPTDLSQLYILLSYEKLQRSTISQRQRPIEASLRNRLLVWRFLKKIENEPVAPLDTTDQQVHSVDPNNSSWILDLHENCDVEEEIDMDIDSDLVTVASHAANSDSNHSTCDSMDMEEESEVTLLLKRAIGAERRQKSSVENLHANETNSSDSPNATASFEETEQFFHDLCAELTNTTAALVSSTSANSLRCPTPPEQALIH